MHNFTTKVIAKLSATLQHPLKTGSRFFAKNPFVKFMFIKLYASAFLLFFTHRLYEKNKKRTENKNQQNKLITIMMVLAKRREKHCWMFYLNPMKMVI
jgi:hypothetical protein